MKFEYLIFLFLLFGCNNQSVNLDKSKLLIDTLDIEGSEFIVFQSYPGRDTSCNLTIIDCNEDTVYIHANYATNGFELEDFDDNGLLDIRMYHLSNIGGISELILYDKKSKSFKEVKNFTEFAQPTKLENSEYWYSYQRRGCADANWESKLFRIQDFKAIEMGKIDGIFCDSDTIKGIFIYKTSEEKMTKIHSEKMRKEEFIDRDAYVKDYWKNNYKKFE